ncbi:hypothetical protein Nepgr_001157 [Nepenthes gracilis]|uniref:Uncharacterized protein n=1 Tax=Nepenthes gracilis TaxID=150966 RepID=A0AAD3P6K6_NEPGR|nr:hypothetical protein Nepgr_001157 [Nepenthes gracilis]
MKQLIRRLSRVADSSYGLVRSDTLSSPRREALSRAAEPSRGSDGSVPSGHLPVYVGEEMVRFVVSANLLNHPIFVMLLNRSAQEYGYQQKGVLRIPCHVSVFERVLEALRHGGDVSRDIHELINSLSPSSDELFL